MSLDYSQEPEKIWKASLLKHQNEAHYFMFIEANFPKAAELMIGWIGILNKASQDNLSDITKELEAAVFDKQHMKARRAYALFREISIHTYNCYLSQGGFGMVQTSTLTPTVGSPQAPKKKAYTEVSAKLT